MVTKSYPKIQYLQKVPKTPSYPKGTYRSKVTKWYLKAPAAGGGGQADTQTDTQTDTSTP